LVIGALSFCSAFASPPRPQSPERTTAAFYAQYLKLRVMGVPDARARKKLTDVLSPGLLAALARADEAEAQYARETLNQVPPLFEGDLFSSLFEGATSYRLSGCTTESSTARCVVDLTHAEGTGPPAIAWRDTLVLTSSVELGWRVDDIDFGGTWEFASKDLLSAVLKDIVADANSISQ